MEKSELKDILESEITDPLLRGFFRGGSGQLWFDRRYNFAAMPAGSTISARTAGLTITGTDILAVPDGLAAELGYNGGQDGTKHTTIQRRSGFLPRGYAP